MHTIVIPDFVKFLNNSITLKAEKESRPDVGSSTIKISGLDIISNAIESLLFYPPDKPLKNTSPTIVSKAEVKPHDSAIPSTIAFFSSLDAENP